MGSISLYPYNSELITEGTSNVSVWDESLSIFNEYESREELRGFDVTPHFIHLGGYGIYRYLKCVGELDALQGFYRDVGDVDVLCVDNIGSSVQIILNEAARTNKHFSFVDEENSSPYRSVVRVLSPGDLRVVFHKQDWEGDIDYYRYLISPKFPDYRVLVRPAVYFDTITTPHPIDMFLLKLDVVNALQRRGDVYNHDLDLMVLLNHLVKSNLEKGVPVTYSLAELFRAIRIHFTEPTPAAEANALLLVLHGSLSRYLDYLKTNDIPGGFENIFPNYTTSSDLLYRIQLYIKNQMGVKSF